MAKKLSRKQRAELKAKQQKQLIRLGFQEKEVRNISNKNLRKLATSTIPEKKRGSIQQAVKYLDRKEQNKIASKKYREKLIRQREEKLEHLERLIGADRLSFKKRITARYLDKLSLEDLRKGKIKRKDIKEYIPENKILSYEKFDWDKVYKIPGNKKLHIAFRSLNGEKDIEEELRRFSNYSIEDLLAFLRTIVTKPLTATKRKKGKKGSSTGSSGQAGEAMINLSTQGALNEVYAKQYNSDRRSNTFAKLLSKTAKKKGVDFQHSGIDYHWQYVKQVDSNGRLKAYTEITGRKILIIVNAVLHSITERDRKGFYNKFKSYACEIIPDLNNILP